MDLSKKEIFLVDILKSGNKVDCHRCDWDCPKEEVFKGTYHCLATGLFHCCGEGCTQKMICDEYTAICRVSGCVFSLSQNEMEAVREFHLREFLLEMRHRVNEVNKILQKGVDVMEELAQKRSKLEEKWAQERSDFNDEWSQKVSSEQSQEELEVESIQMCDDHIELENFEKGKEMSQDQASLVALPIPTEQSPMPNFSPYILQLDPFLLHIRDDRRLLMCIFFSTKGDNEDFLDFDPHLLTPTVIGTHLDSYLLVHLKRWRLLPFDAGPNCFCMICGWAKRPPPKPNILSGSIFLSKSLRTRIISRERECNVLGFNTN